MRFRPRGSSVLRPLPMPDPVRDLRKYEATEEPDDYRHRMIMNVAGLAVTILLIVVGLWIANTMAQMRKNEECALSGRKNCVPIDTSTRTRP